MAASAAPEGKGVVRLVVLAFVAVTLALPTKPTPTLHAGVSAAGVGLPKRPLTPVVAIGRAMRPPPFPLLNWRSSQCCRPLPPTSRPRRPGPVYRPVVPPALWQGLASRAPTGKPTEPSGAKEPLPYPATATAAGGGAVQGLLSTIIDGAVVTR